MSLFRRKKKGANGDAPFTGDPLEDRGLLGVYYRQLARVVDEFENATTSHLARLHEPGGYEREKREHDFMDLGMKREYLEALDDIDFTVEDVWGNPETDVKRRGIAKLVTRWIVHGRHNRPLLGIDPSGDEITIQGITFTTFRDYNIRVEYSYWEIPELTRRMIER